MVYIDDPLNIDKFKEGAWGTGNLDKDTSQEIVEIFKKLTNEQNKCVIVVTHSREVAKQADVVIELSNGNLVKKNINN